MIELVKDLRVLGLNELNTEQAMAMNLVNGVWVEHPRTVKLIDPMDKNRFLYRLPDMQVGDLEPFVRSMASCPKYGLHNPFRNVQRYLMLGDVSYRAAMMLQQKEVADYFARLIMAVMPKSYPQAMAEVTVTGKFLESFGGNRVRFLANGTHTVGNRLGQRPHDYRWPLGPVVIISPFNFPLEIPALQLMGALYMGNRVTIKSASTVSIVIESFVRLLQANGLPMTDTDVINANGKVMYEFLRQTKDILRLLQFTGSSSVAEDLSVLLHGKVRIEDAGFDWKFLGPDFIPEYLDYVAAQCDQDTNAATGQKCSKTSILFVHDRWWEGGIIDRLATRAALRKLDDLTNGAILTETNDRILKHIEKLLELPGARVLYGGKPLENHQIPEKYGAMQPTAVFVPLESIMATPEAFALVTTEVFANFQVVTRYNESNLDLALLACEKMGNHLTAAVVSNDHGFINKVLGATVNGTTYIGYRARTTGAPEWHFFGPAGDPRGAGIGTDQAIINTWSCERCIIEDMEPIDPAETIPLS
jgi:1-pyrroline-5-carboxylate dehydrogenase